MESLLRAGLIWLAIAAIAVVNGGFREILLKKWIEEKYAHLLSTLVLSTVIFVICFASFRWIGAADLTSAWILGFGWLAATLAFEFLAGHYLFGNSWDKIFADYNPTKGRVWLLVPFSILFGPAMSVVGFQSSMVVPFTISQVVASAILALSIWHQNAARWLIAALFLAAGAFNFYVSMTNSSAYLEYSKTALIPIYSDFISGWFSGHVSLLVGTIAIGQLCCSVLLAVGRRWAVLGAIGVTIFLLAIAPLGVGSAFPFSIMVSLAVWASIGLASDRQK